MTWPFIKAIIILPGTALVYVPALILWLTRNTVHAASFPPQSSLALISAMILGAMGLALMIWTMHLFATRGGGGTPAPWEPIQRFIVEGPYRHVRNPMLTGVILALLAEALALGSLPVALWAAVFFALNTLYFKFIEEPGLEERYGQAYRAYRDQVNRWVPKLTPYVP